MSKQQKRTTTSLYLDEVDVSYLNGALHRAVGGEPGRLADLIAYLEGELAHAVATEPGLAKGNSEALTAVKDPWWELPERALHSDLTEYERAWARVKRQWATAEVASVGAELIALSALTYRRDAWREAPDPTTWTGFPFERAWFHPGPFPRSTTQEATHRGIEPATFMVYRRNLLRVKRHRAPVPTSITVDPAQHELARRLLGPASFEWLTRHWARRFQPRELERWTDAPLHAAIHASNSLDYAWMPAAIEELWRSFEELHELRRDVGLAKYGPRVVDPAGKSKAARTAEAFDVAFSDIIDDGGFVLNDVDVPLPYVGVIVMAKRLGLLDDIDMATFEADAFARRFAEALGVEPGADHASWRDAALRTLRDDTEPVDALARHGAAAVHTDAVLHAYLLARTEAPAPRSLIGLLGRGRTLAWPDRWALQRFLGIAVDTPLDDLKGVRRGNLALGRVSPDTWTHLNTVLALVEPSEASGRAGPHFHGALGKRRPQVDIALDTDFIRFALQLAETEPDARTAATTLAKWMRSQADTSRNDDGA